MSQSRSLILVCTGIILFGVFTLPAFGQGKAQITINIPKKSTPPFIPIGSVKAVIALSAPVTAAAPVTFTISNQNAATTPITVVCSPACVPASITFNDNESSSRGADTVSITPSPTTPGDPDRYEMNFLLLSNLALNSSCNNTQQVDPNSYTISVSSVTANKIVGACLESFDGRIRSTLPPINTCTPQNFNSQEIPVPLDDPNDKVATVDLEPQPSFACYSARPPLDVLLVLDKSGSMSSPTVSGLGPTRIDALHAAVHTFLDDWANLTPPNDQVGVVTFDTTASLRAALKDIVTNKNAIEADIDTILPGGATSIGGGLNLANSNLAPLSGRRKVILLLSDGQQNTDPFVAGNTGLYCQNSANPPCTIPPTCTLANACPLSNHPQIYTVTLGPSTTVDAAINQQIANATLGFYLNTETNASLLRPYFVQLLQNFLRFNSYETARLVSGKVSRANPYVVTIPNSATSHNLVVTLMWPNQQVPLRLTVTPPGGGSPIVRENASGLVSLVVDLPLTPPFDPGGNWKIQIEAASGVGVPAASGVSDGSIPFDLHVMTDDAAVKTELSVVPGDYKPGDSIRLRAKLSRFGRPILNMGAKKADRIEVQLVRPGKSVGDILSGSTASAAPLDPDSQSPADAKLFNILKNNPTALVRKPDVITLYDDGKAAHGDDVAGDGVYSALYPATLPGHYDFLFAIESVSMDSVRFSRQQLRTAYVRAVPDEVNTDFQTRILGSGGSNTLSILMTPRTKAGDRMGPGWENYFWFTSPGQTPFKAKDNLDGTYTATLPFTGSKAPIVSVHFENVIEFIGNSVTPDRLPAPLEDGNILTEVPPPPRRFVTFLDSGLAIPHGASSNDVGFSLNAGLEFRATNHFSAEGIFGFHQFTLGSGGATNIYQFSANGKFYLTTRRSLRPFINAGTGGYKLSPGSTSFGGNLGAGLYFVLTPNWGIQTSYNFHAVNTSGAATNFSTIQIGFRFAFAR